MMDREQSSRTRPSLQEIDQYLADEMPLQEAARVRAWIETGENHALVQALTSGWAPPVRGTVDSGRAWESVSPHTMPTAPPVRALQFRTPAVIATRRRIRYLAGMAALLSAAALIVIWRATQTERNTIVSRAYATARAQTAHVALPDGSHVQLAPETRIHYTMDAQGTRTITLHGQAYFTVAPDPARAFLVQTATTTTRILGTAFGVRHYRDDPAAEIAVTEGKVALSAGRRTTAPVLLISGMLAHVADSGVTVNSNADTRAATAWKDGKLIFNDVPVRMVLASAGRWWGYEFRLTDTTLASQHVTTVITITDRVRTMQALKDLLDVTMTFNGTVVTLKARDSAPRQRTPKSKSETYTILTEIGK